MFKDGLRKDVRFRNDSLNCFQFDPWLFQGEFASVEEERDVTETMYHLSDLREFTEYTFWVSAFNRSA